MTRHARAQQCLDLEAWCSRCPAPEEVTRILHRLGFALIFHLQAMPSRFGTVPALPAQYHYRDQHGTEVLYLAGHDANTEGQRLPTHASRFWLTAGRNPAAATRIRSTLSRQWQLRWDRPTAAKEEPA